MADEMVTKEEFNKFVNNLTESLSKELSLTRSLLTQSIFRFDSLLRFLIKTDIMSLNDFIEAQENYLKLNKGIDELNKITSLKSKIAKVMEYNETAEFKVYADDVVDLLALKSMGSITKSLYTLITSIPCSSKFEGELKALVEVDHETN